MFKDVPDAVVVAVIGIVVAIVSVIGNIVVAIINTYGGKKTKDAVKKLDNLGNKVDTVFDNMKTVNSNMCLLNNNFKSFQNLMVELVTTRKPPENIIEKEYSELEPLVEFEPEPEPKKNPKKPRKNKKLGIFDMFAKRSQYDIVQREFVGVKQVMGHPSQDTVAIKK